MGKKNDRKRARARNGQLALVALAAGLVPLGSAFAADAGLGVSGGSAGCSANRLTAGDSKRTIDVNGQARSYFLHVPRNYTGATAVPLIVDYHGHGGNGEGEKNGSGFADQSETSGFIVAYPDGLGGNWNYHPDRGVDDLGFSKAIIKDLGDQGCIDKNRVYAAGFSQGGGMSYGVACYAADAFAAVVSSSYDLYDGQPCSPARPISVLSFRGTADPLARYDGSPGFYPDGRFVGAKETLKRLAAIDHCSGTPKTDSNGCEIYTNCDGGTQVGLCTVQGGGHLSGDPRQSWDFLKQFSLASNGNNDGNSCTPTTITPYVQVNDGSWQQTASVTVDAGAKVKFGPQPISGGSWSWSGGGTSGTSREQAISPASSITVATTYTNSCNAQSTQNFAVNVNPAPNPNPNPSANAIDNGRYNIVSSLSGLNLDISGAGMDDGANVIQYNKNSGANQQFDLEALGDGTYSIRAAHSGKALDVFQWNANDGAELRQWSYTGGKNQRWRIADAGGGLFSITSAFSNKVIDVWQMNKTNGGAVKLYHWTGGPNQKWSFVRAGSNNNGNNGNNGGSATNYTLNIVLDGNGSTSITGSHSYKSGTAVTITATPAQGSVFSGWSGAFTGNTNPLTIIMNGNKSLTAMFMAQNNGNNNNGGGNPVADGLKSVASFPIGVAVNAGGENNSIVSSGTSGQQQAVVFKHFDQMTAGNIMKMSYLHPSEGNFTFGQADDLISLARSHGLDVHGHTLIWHADYQVPGFMKNYGGDFAAMLKNHVQNIVTHFQGRVVSWDVVNEALADDGEGTVGNGLRSTVFSQKMGLNFIDQAFINARAADSNVDLFYNDYNTEANGQKTRNLVALVDGMRSRGVPINGVGFQMHVSIDWPSIGAIEASMKAIADRGLKVKISELDVGMRNAYNSLTAEAAARQKQRYHDIVAAYMKVVPPAQRAGVTVWGVWDSDSWINQPGKPDWPLLFDANFQAKPALQGFGDALLGR